MGGRGRERDALASLRCGGNRGGRPRERRAHGPRAYDPRALGSAWRQLARTNTGIVAAGTGHRGAARIDRCLRPGGGFHSTRTRWPRAAAAPPGIRPPTGAPPTRRRASSTLTGAHRPASPAGTQAGLLAHRPTQAASSPICASRRPLSVGRVCLRPGDGPFGLGFARRTQAASSADGAGTSGTGTPGGGRRRTTGRSHRPSTARR